MLYLKYSLENYILQIYFNDDYFLQNFWDEHGRYPFFEDLDDDDNDGIPNGLDCDSKGFHPKYFIVEGMDVQTDSIMFTGQS